jgi:hypothetical protein
MMRRIRNGGARTALLASLAIGAALLTAASAASAAPAKDPSAPCFFITQWQGWKSPSPNVIYLGVNLHDVYRVDLSAGSSMLQWPDVHLVSRVRGPDTICSAIDLDLEVADDTGIRGGVGGGMREPLIATKLTKLTPDEIAAIPKKYRPN